MIEYTDHRRDPGAWAAALSVSREAIELYLGSEVVDLHVDSFIWTRIWGYDLRARHGHGLLRASFYSQVDFPRIREAQIAGAMWVITTNPTRTMRGRARAFEKNLARLRAILGSVPDDVALVRTRSEYDAARALKKHAAFVAIQGGNAIDANGAVDLLVDDVVLRVTLVHLSRSSLGMTSAPSPLGAASDGLTNRGRDLVRALNHRRVFVDLAHISRRGFFDAVEVHDKTQPLIVTHTGVTGVHPHWRNLDDEQLRAIADSGGTVGVMYQSTFLGDSLFGGKAESIVRHLEHIVNVAGEDCASLGSDWDGAIVTPRDMPTCLELPRLVDLMLRRGWSASRVRKVLGENFLSTLARLRP